MTRPASISATSESASQPCESRPRRFSGNAGVPEPYRLGAVPPTRTGDRLRVSNGSSVETVEALIDSGADATCIPEQVAERLELQPISVLLVGGAGARAEDRLVYRAQSLKLEHIAVDNFAVIGMPVDYAIVGRDLMNRFRVRLDGPVLHFTIE